MMTHQAITGCNARRDDDPHSLAPVMAAAGWPTDRSPDVAASAELRRQPDHHPRAASTLALSGIDSRSSDSALRQLRAPLARARAHAHSAE
jgi:hypothetical protein